MAMTTINDDDDPSDWPYWAKRISATWQKAVESIVDTGRALLNAKANLDHGKFLVMVKHHLPFRARAAQMLMKVAEHPVLSNAHHGSHLPPSWRTLSELATLPAPTVEAWIADGTINPGMQRNDAYRLKHAANGQDQAAAKHAAKVMPLQQMREEISAKDGEIADLQEQLASAESGSGPFNLVDDDVCFIADTIVSIAGEEKARAIANAILDQYKKPRGRPPKKLGDQRS